MKLVKTKIITTFWWKCERMGGLPLPLQEILDEKAQERIRQMTYEGYTCGELFAEVDWTHPRQATPEGGWVCQGWWDHEVVVT